MTSAADALRVLFVDDEAPLREIMRIELPRMGHEVTVCEDGPAALAALEQHTFDAAIVDLRMPTMSGWDVVDHIRTHSPETEVIISTGYGNLETAIQAIRRGAYDFLPKPCKLFEVANVLRRVAEKRAITNKTIALQNRLQAVEGGTELVGTSAAMQRVARLIEKVAPTDTSVLILGETGTGKELVARRIHELSQRASAPFVAVNCGAIPETLVESEFFGHRKGAFTNASVARKGLLEVANGGTLFLDEIGDLDRSMQVKLLRFLESGEVRRVGENEAFHVDVRVICATHRDLHSMVREEAFREDLLYRINAFEIELPPLRARTEDIPHLARALAARLLKRDSVPDDFIAPEALEVLTHYTWKGNVRELRNALEHAVINSGGAPISADDLPERIRRSSEEGATLTGMSFASGPPRTLREVEREMILAVLDKHKGDKRKAAAELGIALKTLYNKLHQYEATARAG